MPGNKPAGESVFITNRALGAPYEINPFLAMVSANALAEPPAVYEKSFDQNMETAYKRVSESLVNNDFKNRMRD
jgi:hypothetical protein